MTNPAQSISWAAPNSRTKPGLGGNVRMRCGLCPRTTNADMMRVLNDAARAALGITASHICDSCAERAIALREIDRDELYELLGAPPSVVAAARAYAVRHGDPPPSRAFRAARRTP